MKPPMFEPVFRIPQAAPAFSRAEAIIVLQNGPPVLETKPKESGKRTPIQVELDVFVPNVNNSTLAKSAIMGTIRLPGLPSFLVR